MLKYFKMIVLSVSLVGILLSIILLRHHVDPSYHSALCGVEQDNGCNVLNRSDISEVFGIPLAYIGFLYYGFALFLGLYSDRGKSFVQSLFLLSTIALVTDIGLLLYSIFVAETICRLCLLTYLVTIALFVLSYMHITQNKSGFVPDFLELNVQKVPMGQIVILIAAFIPVSGGFFYYAFASEGSNKVKNRGSYADHIAIAQNEYIKAYENSPEIKFRGDPISKKGPVKGIINVVEFADYLCPHCKLMADELDKFYKKFPDEVSITYRHYPLDQQCNSAITRPFHQGSCLLAYASYCAAKQNKFWELHHSIFERQQLLSRKPVAVEDVLGLAATAGISRNFMSACLDEKETKQAILLDIQEANELGISGTPTIYINGRKMDFDDFLVERLLMYQKARLSRENGH